MRLAALYALVILFAGGSATAHRDVIFPITPSGFLQRFPDEYGPASISIEASSGDQESVPEEVVVRIGNHQIDLPLCIRKLFVLPPSEDVEAHGSWYHDFSLLPPYLVIDLPRKRNENFWFEGHSLLFNMANGTLVEVKHRQGSEGGGHIDSPLDLSLLCTDDELKQLTPEETSLPVPAGVFDTGHGKAIADCSLLESAEPELECLTTYLSQLDELWTYVIAEILDQAGMAEPVTPEPNLAEWRKFRDHLCQNHREGDLGEASAAVVDMRCRVELTEAYLEQLELLVQSLDREKTLRTEPPPDAPNG